MPLSADFDADFSSFYEACQRATISLTGFESEAADVEARLNRMADSFSGTKVIQDATAMAAAIEKLGGVSGLTDKELQKVARTASEAAQKLSAMGKDVPDNIKALASQVQRTNPLLEGMLGIGTSLAGMFAGLFSVQAIFSFGRALADTADQVTTLATALSISTDEAQKLQYIAETTSTPIGSLTGAIQHLQEQIGSGDEGTAAALKRLGLNIEALKHLSGYELLATVTDALKGIEDEAARSAAEAEVFGGKWKAMAGAVAEGMREVGDQAPLMSETTIENIKRMDAAWEYSKATVTAWAGNFVGEMARAASALSQLVQGDFKKYLETTFSVPMKDMTDSLHGASEAAVAHAKALGIESAAFATALPIPADYNAIIKESNKTINEAIAKNEKHAKAMDELNSVGVDWQTTLSTLNADMVEAIKGYLDANVSQGALQEAYGLTAAQVKSVAEALKMEKLALRETGDLWKEWAQVSIEQTGTATEVAIHNIERWATETAAKMEEVGAATSDFYEGLALATEAKMRDVLVDWDAIAANSADVYRRTLEESAQRAEATYQEILSHSENFSVQTIEQFAEQARAAREAADNWAHSFEAAGEAATAAVERTTEAAKRSAAEVTDAWGKVRPGGTIDTSGIQFHDMNEAMNRYEKLFGGGSRFGQIGGGPAPDFISWALQEGRAFRMPPAASGGAVTSNVTMNGMLSANDPQTKQMITNLVGEALADAMRKQRLLTSA